MNSIVKEQECNDCTISTSGTNTAISASEMDTNTNISDTDISIKSCYILLVSYWYIPARLRYEYKLIPTPVKYRTNASIKHSGTTFPTPVILNSLETSK